MKPFLKAALAALLVLTMFASPLEALIVYSPLQTTIHDNGVILLDVNRDGIIDFQVSIRTDVQQFTFCRGFTHKLTVNVSIVPQNPDNGVVVVIPGLAQLLPLGNEVSSASNFEENNSESIFHYSGCPFNRNVSGYLGLNLQVNGESHYAWTYVLASMFADDHAQVIVHGYAYETIPGMGLLTGQLVGR